MNVYISKCTHGYGGGCAIVAANSPEEAWSIAMQDKRNGYMFSTWNSDNNCEVPSYGENMSPFELFDGLTYKGDTPQVLTINVYYE